MILPAPRRRQAIPQTTISVDQLQHELYRRETEAHFQQWVIDRAKLHGWHAYHTHDSRRSPEGFPDLILIREFPDGGGEGIAAELKTETGKVTPAQETWLEMFRRCGFHTPIWRPSMRTEILRALSWRGT